MRTPANDSQPPSLGRFDDSTVRRSPNSFLSSSSRPSAPPSRARTWFFSLNSFLSTSTNPPLTFVRASGLIDRKSNIFSLSLCCPGSAFSATPHATPHATPLSRVHLGILVQLLYVRPSAKGLVPLPGVKTRAHADEVVGCLGWFLVQEDVDILDTAYRVSGGAKRTCVVRRGGASMSYGLGNLPSYFVGLKSV